MSIDPDELKASRIKREQQVNQIQKYMEEQDALDKENATGKMGHREVKRGFSVSGTIGGIVEKAWNLLKGKSVSGD